MSTSIPHNFSPSTLFLLELADKAAAMMRVAYRPGGQPAESKSDGSAITEIDRAINQMVIDEVAQHFPDHEVLGEEASSDISRSDKLFVVDPIDGTRMFAIGCPVFSFSAAVVEGGTPVAGVVKNPMAQRTLVAEKGLGAWLVEEDKKISVNQVTDLNRIFVELASREIDIRTALRKHNARAFDLRATVEAGALVAIGGTDASIFTGKGAHDIAALKIIVEEAGGKVTDLAGREQRYDQPINGAIVSNGHLHDQLVELVSKSRQTEFRQ